jgi:hypothetical protein
MDFHRAGYFDGSADLDVQALEEMGVQITIAQADVVTGWQ